MSNLSDAKLALAGTLGNDKGGEDVVDQLTDFALPPYNKAAADSMAADATAATRFWTNPFDFDVEIVSGYAIGGALTADASHHATITVATDDGANSTPAAALTWTTSVAGTGTWTADVAKVHTTRTPGNCTVAPGASVHFQIAKVGNGVIVPISSYVVRARRKA